MPKKNSRIDLVPLLVKILLSGVFFVFGVAAIVGALQVAPILAGGAILCLVTGTLLKVFIKTLWKGDY